MLIFESFRVFVSRSNYRVCVLPHRVQFLSSALSLYFNGPFRSSFFFILVFSIQLTVNKCSIFFANDWIRTADLWYRK